ncbi:unnamed protein product, partial [marine sediment metagenome]
MPDIENPTTYAEWFWKNSVDANVLRSEQIEKVLAPIAANIIDSLPDIEELPTNIAALFNAIKSPKDPALDNVLFKFTADLASSMAQRVLGHDMKGFDYKVNAYLQNTHMTPDVANILMMRKKVTPDFWLARQNDGGFSDGEGKAIYESLKPYPSMPDIIAYSRYQLDPLDPYPTTEKLFDIPSKDWPLWEWLSRQKLNTEQVSALYKRKFWDE